MGRIVAEPLSGELFLPFGWVTSASGSARSANLGTARRYDFTAELDNTRPEARANLAVFQSRLQVPPFRVELLERHAFSTQTFLPLICGRFLVVVAPSDEKGHPKVEEIRAFVGSGGQGMTYRVGLWHYPLMALDCDAELAMLAWEDGSPADCEECSIPLVEVVLP